MRLFVLTILLIIGFSSLAQADDGPRLLVKVEPRYPKDALLNDVSGWCKLSFTVSELGATSDITPVECLPVGVFEQESIRAVQRWRYVPHLVNGQAVEVTSVTDIVTFGDQSRVSAAGSEIVEAKRFERAYESALHELFMATCTIDMASIVPLFDDDRMAKWLLSPSPTLFADLGHCLTIGSDEYNNKVAAYFQLLFDNGYEFSTYHLADEAALIAATETRQVALVNQLLAHGALPGRPESAAKSTALCRAAHNDSADIALSLLAAGADGTAPCAVGDGSLSNALKISVYRGSLQVLPLLLANNADLDEQGALITAAYSDHGPDAMKMLLAAGANPNKTVSESSFTPLHIAAGNCSKAKVQLLLSAGADANALDKYNNSPLDDALKKDCPESIASLLVSYGGEISNYAPSSRNSDDNLLGKVLATAAIAGVAAQADLSADDFQKVTQATVNDIWVNNGQGNELAALRESARSLPSQDIKDPTVKSLVATRESYATDVKASQANLALLKASQKQAGTAAASDEDCQSMRINLDTLANSQVPELKQQYAAWQQQYAQNCRQVASADPTVRRSYFAESGQKSFEACDATNEPQVSLLCDNAMAHYYEYRSRASKGADQKTLDGLYNAHSQSAQLYLKSLHRLKVR